MMSKYGAKPDRILEARRKQSDFHSFLELHIEQGQVLEDLSKPVGIVSGMSGTYRMNISIHGRSGHAGATPMRSRQDPMIVAGMTIKEMEHFAKQASPLTAKYYRLYQSLSRGC